MIDENDKIKIKHLYFKKMMKLEEIEKYFNGKYTYQELNFATKKMIGEYNGITIEAVK